MSNYSDSAKNREMYEEAITMLTGGACAGGRNNIIYGMPLYIDHADGCRLYSVDGNEYIDYHCGAGAAMFGHNHPRIKNALLEAMKKGFFMNHDTEKTLEFARLFKQIVPSVEAIRVTNSGTESTQAAIRAARGYTGKKYIIKMDGHFHGMHEMVWYNHGNFPHMNEVGEVEASIPDSEGILPELGEYVKVIRYNDIDALNEAVIKYNNQIAAVILEPISFNCGCYAGKKEYLQKVREVCTKNNIVLIFDEVITGLRFSPGSAQGYYGVDADLSTFGKAIAGGLSLSLVGGKKEIMDVFNPIGPVVCSGTTSGNQLSVYAAVECLKMALEPDFFGNIDKKAKQLYDGINDLMQKHGICGHVRGLGARFAIYFGCEDEEADYALRDTMKVFDIELNARFVKAALDNGLYFHYYGSSPYPAHCGFSVQHTEKDIELSLEKIDTVFKTIK